MRITNATQSNSAYFIKKLVAIIMASYSLPLTLEAKEIIPLDGVWQFALECVGELPKVESRASFVVTK